MRLGLGGCNPELQSFPVLLLRIWGLLSLVHPLSSLGGALVEVCLVWGLAADSGTDVWMSPCPGVGPVALGARKPRQERGTVPSSASASPPPVMLTVDLVVAGQQGQGQATPVLALRLTSRLSPPPPSTWVYSFPSRLERVAPPLGPQVLAAPSQPCALTQLALGHDSPEPPWAAGALNTWQPPQGPLRCSPCFALPLPLLPLPQTLGALRSAFPPAELLWWGAAPLPLSLGLGFLICKEEDAFGGSGHPPIPGGDVTMGAVLPATMRGRVWA